MRLRAILVAAVVTVAVAVPAPVHAGPTVSSLPHCDNWTRFTATWYTPDDTWHVLPTVGNNTRAALCQMGVGNTTAAVWVLQALSLNKCHQAGLAEDSIYGQRTKDAVLFGQAVARNQGKNVSVDGIYGPETADHVLKWAFYSTATNAFWGCVPIDLVVD